MRKLKTKTIPCLVMLLGGAITLGITYFNHYPSAEMIKILFISLLACYFVGTMVKIALDKIEIPEETDENDGVEDMSEEMTEDLEAEIPEEIEEFAEEEMTMEEDSGQFDYFDEDSSMGDIDEEMNEEYEEASIV